MPVGAAVSTEVSAWIRTSVAEHSPHPSLDSISQYRATDQRHTASTGNHNVGPVRASPPSTGNDGVSTRRMTSMEVTATPVRPPRQRFDIALLPRITSNPLAANCLCYVLHPDKNLTIVAEGRTGGSWKSPSQKLGTLCSNGEQMVQIHKLIVPNLPLLLIEDRQPFTLLEHAVVKPSGSSVYVKWQTQLLVRKTKASATKKNKLPVVGV